MQNNTIENVYNFSQVTGSKEAFPPLSVNSYSSLVNETLMSLYYTFLPFQLDFFTEKLESV